MAGQDIHQGGPERQAPFALPGGVAFCGLPIRDLGRADEGLSLLDERHGEIAVALPGSLRRAVAKRRAEFLAGRVCAAIALADIGFAVGEVPVNADRSPRWPEGVIGSIAHGAGRAMAVAAAPGRLLGLGLDCEAVMTDARAAGLSGTILSPGDAAFRPDGMALGEFVTLVFSAKEALYKAVYPRVRHVFGFHAVQIRAIAGGRIAMDLGDVPGAGGLHSRRFEAVYVAEGGALVCLVVDPV